MVGRGDRDGWWGKLDPPDGVNLLDGFGVFNGVAVVMLYGSPVPGSQDWTSQMKRNNRIRWWR